MFGYLSWVGSLFNFHIAPMSLLLLPNNNEEIKVPIGKITYSSNLKEQIWNFNHSLSDTKAYVLVFLEHWTAFYKAPEIQEGVKHGKAKQTKSIFKFYAF